ncbi:MAG TPA: helix-turn-helix domain-containing protein [Burkholderiales bacterium]|nr:helix-turn-helix domain-containing protein [Burkholderiales bacterium]
MNAMTARLPAVSKPGKPAPRAKSGGRMPVDPWSDTCPSRDVIGLLASKWVMLLIPLLRRGPRRNGDLMRGIAGVSQKMLTQTLRDLQRHGLVARRDFLEVPPRVEYALTPLGDSLAKTIASLDDWVIRHYYDMAKAHGESARE